MDDTILTLHPITEETWNVLKDPHHQDMITIVERREGDDDQESCESKALALRLTRPPKVGTEYVIGRGDTADIMLTDSETARQFNNMWNEGISSISSLHCAIFINDKGTPWLRDGSTNGTIIDGKYHHRGDAVMIKDGTKIQIRDFGFLVHIPWREDQAEYEYQVKRARETRAQTPQDIWRNAKDNSGSRTSVVQRLGDYQLTGGWISSTQSSKTYNGTTDDRNWICKMEVVRKGKLFFAAKYFKAPKLGKSELNTWSLLKGDLPQTYIVELIEIFHHKSAPIIIMELHTRTVEDLIQEDPSSATEIAPSIMQQLFHALIFLHAKSIVHNALLMESLLLFSVTPPSVKLSGFEYSSLVTEAKGVKTMPRSPEEFELFLRIDMIQYWKELLQRQNILETERSLCRGTSIDIWAAGVLCCRLFLHVAPQYHDPESTLEVRAEEFASFIGASRKDDFKDSARWAKLFRLPPVPPQLEVALQKLLEPIPSQRATATEALNIPWANLGDREVEKGEDDKCAHKRRRMMRSRDSKIGRL